MNRHLLKIIRRSKSWLVLTDWQVLSSFKEDYVDYQCHAFSLEKVRNPHGSNYITKASGAEQMYETYNGNQ